MMKLFDKIRECLSYRKTSKEEEWEVPPSKGSDIIDRYHKFMMQVNEDNLNHSRETHKFNKDIDSFENSEVPFSTSGARKPESEKSRISKDLKSIEEWILERKKVIESFERFGIPAGSLKVKYYKRKVDVFHGLQGFKWEYSIEVGRSCDLDSISDLKKEMGYIEITREELEVSAK